jgi:hypothetical protein
MKRLLVHTAFIFTFIFPVVTNAQGFTVRGLQNCGEWVESRNKKNNASFSDQAFLIGMLNGMNVSHYYLSPTTPAVNVFGESTPKNEQIFLWMDKYCKENPLKDTMDGAVLLFAEITKTPPMYQ